MTRPITKELPRGSRLRVYVERLQTVIDNEPPFWRSEDPKIRAMGVVMLLREEPRLWKLPREIVRDELVLPAIAEVDGPEVATALRGTKTLDEYVDLVCEEERRRTPAKARFARAEDIEGLTLAVVTVAAYSGCAQGMSNNARHERAAKRLGIDRHAVRRAAEKYRQFLNSYPAGVRTALIEALGLIGHLMDSYDRQDSYEWERGGRAA